MGANVFSVAARPLICSC